MINDKKSSNFIIPHLSPELDKNLYESACRVINKKLEHLVFKGTEKEFESILCKELLSNPILKKVSLSDELSVEDIFNMVNRLGAGNLGDFEAEFYMSKGMLDKLKNTFDKSGCPIAYKRDDRYYILGYFVNIIETLNEEDGIIFADLFKSYIIKPTEKLHFEEEDGCIVLKGKIDGKISDYRYIVVAQ